MFFHQYFVFIYLCDEKSTLFSLDIGICLHTGTWIDIPWNVFVNIYAYSWIKVKLFFKL